jgi:hypothetical protein
MNFFYLIVICKLFDDVKMMWYMKMWVFDDMLYKDELIDDVLYKDVLFENVWFKDGLYKYVILLFMHYMCYLRCLWWYDSFSLMLICYLNTVKCCKCWLVAAVDC